MPISSSARTRLEFQHRTIRELIGDHSEEVLKRRPDPEKWSVFENIAHMACYQPVFLHRLETIRKEESPAFGRYKAETDPEFPAYLQRSLQSLFEDMTDKRAALYHALTGMSEDRLLRTGTHPRFGPMTVIQWTEFFLLHEAHHIYTIFMLVRQTPGVFR
ncbi:MAG TPA: DinB family protein [Puia sp.]|nr:DinB family protein [Puia sp.]